MKFPALAPVFAVLAATVVAGTLTHAAMAQERGVLVRSELVFRAPLGCPSRGDLVRRVTSRFSNVNFDAAKSSTSFLVTIEPAPSESSDASGAASFQAELESAGPSGPQRRTLHAPTCGELVDAVALMIALTLDADNTQPDAAPIARDPAPLPVGLPPIYVPFLRLGLGSEFGSLPHPAVGIFGALGLELAHARSLVAPSFALEPSVLTSDLLAPTPSLGSYTRFGLRGEACPLRIPLGRLASLRPCAFLGIGAIRAEGTAAPTPETQVIFWADVGAVLRARLEINAFFVEASGGAAVPITSPNYVLQAPSVTLYQTPPVTAVLGLSLGVRFL